MRSSGISACSVPLRSVYCAVVAGTFGRAFRRRHYGDDPWLWVWFEFISPVSFRALDPSCESHGGLQHRMHLASTRFRRLLVGCFCGWKSCFVLQWTCFLRTGPDSNFFVDSFIRAYVWGHYRYCCWKEHHTENILQFWT